MGKWKTLTIKKFERCLQYSLDDREDKTDSYTAISGFNTNNPNTLLRNHLAKSADVETYPADNEPFTPVFFDFGGYLYYINQRSLFRIDVDGTSTHVSGMKTYIDAEASFSTGIITSVRIFNNSVYCSFSLGTTILKMTIADDLSITYAKVGNFLQNSLEVAHSRIYCLGQATNNNLYYSLDGTTWVIVPAPAQTTTAKLMTHPNNFDIIYDTHGYNGNDFYEHNILLSYIGNIPDVANGNLKPQVLFTRQNDVYGVYLSGKFKPLQSFTDLVFASHAYLTTLQYPVISCVSRYRNKLLIGLCITTARKAFTGTVTTYYYLIDPIEDTCEYLSSDISDVSGTPPVAIINPNSNHLQLVYLWIKATKRIVLNFRSFTRLYGTTFGTTGYITLTPLSFGSPHIPTIIKSVAVTGTFPGSPTLKVQAIIDGISITDLCSATLINQSTIQFYENDLLPERTRYQLKFLFENLASNSPTRIDTITIMYCKKGNTL